MTNTELTLLTVESFNDKAKFPFLKRVKLVNLTEEEIPETVGTVIVADVVEGEEEPFTGTFEFVPMAVPNIKCGVTLKDRNTERLKSIAQSLGIATNQRLNELVVAFMVGSSTRLGFYVKSQVSEDLHVEAKPTLESIAEKVNQLKEVSKVKYDRATLSSALLSALTGETGVVQAKKVFKASTGLKVEVDDTYFRERNKSGDGSVKIPTIPENKIILSNSKYDNSDIFYLANLPVNEPVLENEEHGLVAYTTEKHAWSVIRAIPIMKEPTTFASITCK